jgi:very-short-patch-repair endonuclease
MVVSGILPSKKRGREGCVIYTYPSPSFVGRGFIEPFMIYYNPKLKQYARSLRNNPTCGERKLWKYLKGNQFLNLDFHRQKPIDNFIADFFCPKLNLIIEINGSSHDLKYEYDKYREQKLQSLGFSLITFTEYDALNNTEQVLQSIENFVNENAK